MLVHTTNKSNLKLVSLIASLWIGHPNKNKNKNKMSGDMRAGTRSTNSAIARKDCFARFRRLQPLPAAGQRRHTTSVVRPGKVFLTSRPRNTRTPGRQQHWSSLSTAVNG